MEEHQSEGHPGSGNEEELEQSTNVDVTTTKSPRKGKRTAKRKSIAQPKGRQTADPSWKQQDSEKNAEEQQTNEPSTRKSPRTRSGVQGAAPTAQRSGKRKHPNNQGPKLLLNQLSCLSSSMMKPGRGLNGSRRKVSSLKGPSFPTNSDKGKTPATEEETEEDDNDEDEDTEEEDPAQFRLVRRRSGSSKITI
ncbi:high mobility group protein B2-like [Coffea eugenioides]|uniref:high mobility group protein B2-like n=1 Tax=Coffea eugenioides TaxID=49369 RepID=UPI000F60DA8D|nr:high mobility group protein B2-like [Coffea eugenioides]